MPAHVPPAIGPLSAAAGCLVAWVATAVVAEQPAPPPAAIAGRAAVVTTAERPVRQIRAADGRVFVDFGRATFGWLTLEWPAPHPAAALTVRLGEKLAAADTIDRKPGGSIAFQEVAIQAVAGDRLVKVVPRWTPKYGNWVPVPDGTEEVAPFRYAEIEGLPAAADAPAVVRMSRHVPWDESAAAFACSDPALVEVWDLCKHSIKATSFLGLYVDGNRERIAYEADAYINQLCHYGVDAHYATGRLTLEHLLAFPTWPTEWRQHVPLMAWADWLYSGDDAALRRHYAAIRGSVMLDRRRPDGLFLGQAKGVPRDIVDWPAGERDGYDMAPDVKTVTSAFHARSLEAMATIARATGRDDEADEFAALREATGRAMRDRLFDEARGCYVDGLDPTTGKPSRHASLHANMLPLAFGLVPEADVPRVAAFVAGRGMRCSVYGAQYLLDALFDANRDRDALELLTATDDRSWLHMSRDLGSTVTLEAWNASAKPNLDWNHAWGAVPANVIPRKLMGIEPLEPGFTRIRVRPRIGGLEWATIRHPSPRGPIDLAIRNARGTWQASLDQPDGTTGELHVPAATIDDLEVSVAGRVVEPVLLRREGGRCVIEIGTEPTTVTVDPAAVSRGGKRSPDDP